MIKLGANDMFICWYMMIEVCEKCELIFGLYYEYWIGELSMYKVVGIYKEIKLECFKWIQLSWVRKKWWELMYSIGFRKIIFKLRSCMKSNNLIWYIDGFWHIEIVRCEKLRGSLILTVYKNANFVCIVYRISKLLNNFDAVVKWVLL